MKHLISDNIKLTAVDLNSDIAKSKGYTKDTVVLETATCTFKGYKAWLEIVKETKYKWSTSLMCRPFFMLAYMLISKNRKLINKILKDG